MAIDPGWGSALWVAGLFAVASILAAYGLEPLVYRASIGIAPFAHVISVVFWALMWGPLGLILAPALTAGSHSRAMAGTSPSSSTMSTRAIWRWRSNSRALPPSPPPITRALRTLP